MNEEAEDPDWPGPHYKRDPKKDISKRFSLEIQIFHAEDCYFISRDTLLSSLRVIVVLTMEAMIESR